MSWVAVVNAGIDGDLVRDMMLEAVENRFAATEAPVPIQWLSDNAPSLFCCRGHAIVRKRAGLERPPTN